MNFITKKDNNNSKFTGFSYPIINPVAFSIGPLNIYWYGLAYLAGIFSGIFLGKKSAKWIAFNTDISDYAFSIVLGIIIGGRLGYIIFYEPFYYLQNPLDMFAIWKGGMAFHGGAFGAFCGAFFYCKKHKLSIRKGMDILAFCATPGLLFGRIANFINGELYGRKSDIIFAMTFPSGGTSTRHPSQLYEAFFEGFILFLVLLYVFKKRYKIGKVFTVFVFGYSIIRFFIEFTREPDSQLGYLLFNLSMGQYLSFLMILFGVWWINYEKNK